MRRIFLVSALTIILLMKVNYTFAGRPFLTETPVLQVKVFFNWNWVLSM
jgi:hypothetical protein